MIDTNDLSMRYTLIPSDFPHVIGSDNRIGDLVVFAGEGEDIDMRLWPLEEKPTQLIVFTNET
ncbi:MAG: hypothetical protein M0R06_02075 [Sphaerochaeta sp.]|nr:hypothetical protein [Sphaerochaeta sp.]